MFFRTSQQSSSKFTPFELLYKRKPRLPIEMSTLPRGDGEDEANPAVTPECLEEHMEAMIKWAEAVNAKAKANIEKAQSKQKKEFDAKHLPSTFKVGDKVWVYNSRKDTRQGGKLEWNWKGPFEIVEQTTRGTYRLKNMNGKVLKQAVSSNRLKAHKEPDPVESQVRCTHLNSTCEHTKVCVHVHVSILKIANAFQLTIE